MMLKILQILGGMEGLGKLVKKILVVEDVYVFFLDECDEFYVFVFMDWEKKCNVIIYFIEGGMDIEIVVEEMLYFVYKEYIDLIFGLQGFQVCKIVFNFGLNGKVMKEMVKFISFLYKVFVGVDVLLFEINFCLKIGDDCIIVVDCKVMFDDNVLYCYFDFVEFCDIDEEDLIEVEVKEYGLNYVQLDGNVGCMVNGVGLAMVIMDIIKFFGGEFVNFFDVGGIVDVKCVEQVFCIIFKDLEVKAIFINIFGGIVCCDCVVQGVVDVYKNMGNIEVFIIVCL